MLLTVHSFLHLHISSPLIEFKVHVWEKETISGGVATSEDLRGEGDVYINDGVQGGSTS